MKAPRVGYEAPIFLGECTSNKIADLSQLKGKKVILYFYPKDSTPGCTTEGQDFRDLYKKFTKSNAVIYGLSRDSIKSHETFKEKQSFPFDLISDPTEKICKQYDVIKEKYDIDLDFFEDAPEDLVYQPDIDEKKDCIELISEQLSYSKAFSNVWKT